MLEGDRTQATCTARLALSNLRKPRRKAGQANGVHPTWIDFFPPDEHPSILFAVKAVTVADEPLPRRLPDLDTIAKLKHGPNSNEK